MKHTARMFRWMILLVGMAGLALALLSSARAAAAETAGNGPHNPAGGIDLQATPVPESTPTNAPRTGSPIVGILVLLAPAVWLVWKSHQDKQLKKRKAAA